MQAELREPGDSLPTAGRLSENRETALQTTRQVLPLRVILPKRYMCDAASEPPKSVFNLGKIVIYYPNKRFSDKLEPKGRLQAHQSDLQKPQQSGWSKAAQTNRWSAGYTGQAVRGQRA